jgi:putative hydrolases of HD superfamily
MTRRVVECREMAPDGRLCHVPLHDTDMPHDWQVADLQRAEAAEAARFKVPAEVGRAAVGIARLTLRLGRVERITFHPHPDAGRPETVTDHTVMLGVLACSFAARFLTWLDLGRVAQYALVHDLVEAYAGDTPTLVALTRQQHEAKRERERRALELMREEFDHPLPWLADAIWRYESQQEPEARYVKALDKLTPKLTHILNEGRTLILRDTDQRTLIARYEAQLRELRSYAADFPPLFDLYDQLVVWVLEATYPGQRHSFIES